MKHENPHRPAKGVQVEYVSASAGAGKTMMAVGVCRERVLNLGAKVIYAVPTLRLIDELVELAGREPKITVCKVTSAGDDGRRRYSVPDMLVRHLVERDAEGRLMKGCVEGPRLTFITHECLARMTFWPDHIHGWEIVIDEAPDPVLTREPFRLRDNFYVLTSFLDVAPSPPSLPELRRAAKRKPAGTFTVKDAMQLRTILKLIDPASNAPVGEVAAAEQQRDRLFAKLAAQNGQDAHTAQWHCERLVNLLQEADPSEYEITSLLADRDRALGLLPDADDEADGQPAYYMVVPKEPVKPEDDPYAWIERRVSMKAQDDIYDYLDPIPLWLMQGSPIFTAAKPWKLMTERGKGNNRGLITISGFRRPDYLARFKRVTMMSALFTHTMLYQLWATLGVRFVESPLIRLDSPVTPLGSRRLKLYWLTDEGWSKRARDRAGGMEVILDLIARSGAIDMAETVCISVNKDVADEADPGGVKTYFPNAVIMPHNSRGQNRFRHHHQMIHAAALNSYTPDIRWLEHQLGIDSHTQRIARTGTEIYQTMMRLSLREALSKHDVSVVVADKDVALWLAQWFTPLDQVEIIEIDTTGVIRSKGKAGRPAIGARPMTGAERQAAYRARKHQEQAEAAE